MGILDQTKNISEKALEIFKSLRKTLREVAPMHWLTPLMLASPELKPGGSQELGTSSGSPTRVTVSRQLELTPAASQEVLCRDLNLGTKQYLNTGTLIENMGIPGGHLTPVPVCNAQSPPLLKFK